MKINIILTRKFEKELNKLIKSNKLLMQDYKEFKEEISKFPEKGDIIPNTSGVRKIRIKSASSGKSGGFRICYYYLTKDKELFLILIYPKNIQEDLTPEQTKLLKKAANEIKKK